MQILSIVYFKLDNIKNKVFIMNLPLFEHFNKQILSII